MQFKTMKKSKPTEQINPFDIHVNRQKHKILGRRPMKWETGKPLHSRHIATLKRKETLLPELKNLNKSGKGVIDQRAAITSRKAKLYQDVPLSHEKETNLTHKGEELDEERLNQPVQDDDDDDEFDLLRRGDYVDVAHFGGGETGAPLSSEDFMKIVMDDKRKKQIEKEENIRLTEELDKNWSTVRNLIKHKGAKDETAIQETEEYDILLNQLMFGGDDRKATVSKPEEAVKTEDVKPSSSVLITEHLQNIVTTDDMDLIFRCVDSLLHLEIKKLNSTVVKKFHALLKAKEMKICSLKSIAILFFLISFKELEHYVLLKFIDFLRNLRYNSIDEIGKRLLICDFLHSIYPEKYFPEITMSIQNILVLFEPVYKTIFIPTFVFDKIASSEILAWSEDMDFKNLPQFSLRSFFKGNISSSNQAKSIILVAVVDLIEKIYPHFRNFDSFAPIFSKITPILSILQEKLPKPMTDRLFVLLEKFNEPRELSSLSFEQRKPLMVTMLEPRLSNYKRKDDKKKLQKKYKREYKSTARELRKDNAFVRDTILKDTIAKDDVRKRKVKKLLADIAQEKAMFKKSRR